MEGHTEQMEERPATTPPGPWGDAPCPWRGARESVAHAGVVLEGGTASPAAARRFVARAVAGLDREVREDLVLLASELVTNAVLHGRAGAGPHEVGLDVHVSRRWVTVTVTDDGAGFDPGVLTGPRPGVPGAHGLQMVAALSDMRGIDSRDPFRIWFGRLL